MNIRKWFALCLAVALALPLGAFAQEEVQDLEGYVTQVMEDGFVLEDKHRGTVILNTDDATVWDGLLMDNPMEEGMYVIVQYDGRLTRSVPPQAHADRVGCYTIQGEIGEFVDGGILVTGDELFGDVWVNLELVDTAHLFPEMRVLAYYDGVMALSLPGRITAHELIVPSVSGTVSEKKEGSFLLTTDGGDSYRVLMTEETVTGVVSAATEEGEETPATDDAQPEPTVTPVPTLEWGDGDAVAVYYNGDLQESTPPQLTALEVVVFRN